MAKRAATLSPIKDCKGTVSLDDVDLEILEVLRADGRVTVPALAERVHVSRATGYARLQRLRDVGIIRGFGAVIDPRRVGLTVTALVLVTSARSRQGPWKSLRDSWMSLRDELANIAAVEWVGILAGETDIALLVRARDQDDLRSIVLDQIQSLPSVGNTRTLTVLEEVVHRPYVLPPE